MPPPALMLKEGSQIEQFTVLGLCGHSPGSSGFYDEKSKVLFSGDTLFNNGVGRTDLPDSDGQKIKQSLARLFLLPPDTKVFPGHGRATAIGVESERIILD